MSDLEIVQKYQKEVLAPLRKYGVVAGMKKKKERRKKKRQAISEEVQEKSISLISEVQPYPPKIIETELLFNNFKNEFFLSVFSSSD